MDRGLRREFRQIVADLVEWVRYQQLMGASHLPLVERGAIPVAVPEARAARVGELFADGEEWLAGVASLATLHERLKDCQRCRLAAGRRQVVFGVGSDRAQLMFVGEAPGREEDLQGEPFVGRAGQLLTRMIEALGLSRRQVYIANIIKCRPPENRNPSLDEMASCKPFLLKQVELIRPQIICALGNFAAQVLIKTDKKISQLRGRFHPYHLTPRTPIKVIPTFHPAYLLRNPMAKRAVWEDMKLIKQELERLRGAGR